MADREPSAAAAGAAAAAAQAAAQAAAAAGAAAAAQAAAQAAASGRPKPLWQPWSHSHGTLGGVRRRIDAAVHRRRRRGSADAFVFCLLLRPRGLAFETVQF